jgi:hypothetical protein
MTGVIIDPTSDTVAFSMLKSEFPVDNVYTDPWSGEVLIIMNDTVNTIYLVSFELPKQTARWRSKIWHNSELRNVSAVKVNFDEGSVRNETVMPQATAITNDKGVIRFFADGKMVWERPLDKPSELMRMPSGYKADYYQFEIETKWRIHSVEFATSVKELAAV